MTTPTTEQRIWDILQEVKDPEIPVVSLVELGVIAGVALGPDGAVQVDMIPTFAGCPAINLMKLQAEEVLRRQGFSNVTVQVNYNRPWSSNYITPRGRQLLKQFGLAPPPPVGDGVSADALLNVPCPRCDGTNTYLTNTFGPTLCRATHYCNDCHEAFQQFKPL
jgi:ring-1,2-phenylacetyl-CoA epoxidase subunit PaaD